jgi:hypothetical protein
MAYMVAGSDQVFGGNFQPGGITSAAQRGNPAAQKLVQMGYQQPARQQQPSVTQPQANVTKAPDMSMYAPGKAQPTQAQSQGSPYGNPQTGGGYQMPEPPTGGGFQLPQQQSQGYPMPQPPGSQYLTNEPPVATSSGRLYGGDMMVPYSDAAARPTQSGGLMADPEETRRYDEIMARNGVSRQDYADPRYQDYLRAQGQGTGDSKRDIEEFGRYKQTGQTQNRLPPPVNSAQPMPGQDGIPQDAVFRGMPGTYAMPPQVQTQMTDMFGNPTTPDQYFPQQDAFVAQLIERLGQNQSGTYLGQGPPPADWGRPQPFDINNLWGNAGDMVQGGWRNPFAAPMQADPYQDLSSSLPGNNAPQPGPIDPRYTPPASPGGRYTPVAPREDSQTRDMRPQYDNADRFIRELTRTNPATWTETQWADYERAQRDTGLMDGGGYYRDQQGNVRYGGGYGPADRPADPTIGRDSRQDQYGTWGGSGGGSYSPQRPGQAQAVQPQSQGTPYMPNPDFAYPTIMNTMWRPNTMYENTQTGERYSAPYQQTPREGTPWRRAEPAQQPFAAPIETNPYMNPYGGNWWDDFQGYSGVWY